MLVTPGWESSAFHLQILGTGAPPGTAPPGYGWVVAGEKGHAVSKGGLCYGGDMFFGAQTPSSPGRPPFFPAICSRQSRPRCCRATAAVIIFNCFPGRRGFTCLKGVK